MKRLLVLLFALVLVVSLATAVSAGENARVFVPIADENGDPFDGSQDYILHFDTLPPVMETGFRSVTAYGNDDFLIANPLDRYCVNDRSDFRLNESIADIVTGIILFFIIGCEFFVNYQLKFRHKEG